MKREYTDVELAELVRTVRVARDAPRGPMAARILFLLASLAPLTVLGLLVAMAVGDPRAMFEWWPVLVVAVLLFVAAYFACVWLRRRFKRWVMTREGKVCPNCHYDLREVDEREEMKFCPECREPYRPGELRRIWSGWSPGMVWWD